VEGTDNFYFFHPTTPTANVLGSMTLFVDHAGALLIRSFHALTLCLKIWHLFSGLKRQALLNLIRKTNKTVAFFASSAIYNSINKLQKQKLPVVKTPTPPNFPGQSGWGV